MCIQVICVNLPNRTERKKSFALQFDNLEGFNVEIVRPIKHNIGVISLWRTLQYIISEKVDWGNDFFIFCEDDHQFTENWDIDLLFGGIRKAQILKADILSGGISWFQNGIQVSNSLFWVEKFTGLQFTVIFRKIYREILEVNHFTEYDAADRKISEIANSIFVLFPFISIQKEFGYSDVTPVNNDAGRVHKLFNDSYEKFALLNQVRKFYLPDIGD